MLEDRVEVINGLGLHARAAAKLVKLALKFRSRIMLTNLERTEEANAKSILSLLSLAASVGTVLIVTVDGEDEASAMSAVKEIFEKGFGEEK